MAGPAVATLLKLIRAKASRKAIEKAIKGLSKPGPGGPKPQRPIVGDRLSTRLWKSKVSQKLAEAGKPKPRSKITAEDAKKYLAGTGKPKTTKKPDKVDEWGWGMRKDGSVIYPDKEGMRLWRSEVNRRVASRGWVVKKGKVVKKKQDDWEEGRRFERETNRLIRERKQKAALAAKRKIKGLGLPPLAK